MTSLGVEGLPDEQALHNIADLTNWSGGLQREAGVARALNWCAALWRMRRYALASD